MDWSSVNIPELLRGVQQAETKHPPRPWGEFFHKFNTPKNATKATSRVKCNLYYYRTNYSIVICGATGACLLRNPLGTVSLGLLGLGAALFLDTVASAVSSKALAVVQQVNAQWAMRVRAQPGGHDGRSVPPGRQVRMKVMGFNRDAVANCMLGVGSIVALLTGAVGTLTMGLGLGCTLVAAHAAFRTPNLKAKLNHTQAQWADRDFGI